MYVSIPLQVNSLALEEYLVSLMFQEKGDLIDTWAGIVGCFPFCPCSRKKLASEEDKLVKEDGGGDT